METGPTEQNAWRARAAPLRDVQIAVRVCSWCAPLASSMTTCCQQSRSFPDKAAGPPGCYHDRWSPKIVGTVNDSDVKLAKIEGEFVWHAHEHEDELLLVLAGRLVIELRDGAVTLEPGECVVIPKGVEHRPVAPEEVHVLLVEPGGIRHTGNVVDARTITEYERI